MQIHHWIEALKILVHLTSGPGRLFAFGARRFLVDTHTSKFVDARWISALVLVVLVA